MPSYCSTCKETTNCIDICPKCHKKFTATQTSIRLRKIYLYVKERIGPELKEKVEALSLDALQSDPVKFEADLKDIIEAYAALEDAKSGIIL
jgi:CRISPR/Cas system CSM-associated protein Csm2 small subunit